MVDKIGEMVEAAFCGGGLLVLNSWDSHLHFVVI